jgi:RNA polymerase sigma-70 factor (ECF subfamily)
MSTPQDDPMALLAAARGGDADALGRALEVYRDYLLAIADRELNPDLRAKGGASDLVQETCLHAQRDLAGFRGSTEEELRAWLRSLLEHRLAHFVRRYRATQKRGLRREVALDAGDSALSPAGALAADTPTPSMEAVAHEQAELIQRILQRLPEDYRTVITLRYQDDLSFEEIGHRLGRTAEAARKLWWRAVERLQDEMESPS